MKYMKYPGLAALAVVMVSGLVSCNDGEESGSKEVKVWIDNQLQPHNTYEYTIEGNLIENTIVFDKIPSVKFPVRISRPIAKDVHIRLKMESSGDVLAAYNAANGTNFEMMPAEAIELKKVDVTIKAGEMVSADSIHVELKGDGLRATRFYWMSVSIADVDSDDKGVSLSLSPMLTSSYFIIKGAGESSILVDKDLYKKATPLDRSKWTIKATTANFNTMKDADLSTYWRASGKSQSITVDMGVEVDLQGLAFTPAQFHWFIDDDDAPDRMSSFRKIEVFIGKSEQEMLSVGIVELPKALSQEEPSCVRFAKAPARFFKVVISSKWSDLDISFGGCAELNAY